MKMFTEIYVKPQQLATEVQPYLFYVYLLSFQKFISNQKRNGRWQAREMVPLRNFDGLMSFESGSI